ncbi:MAG TPA: hypothetical protein VKB78_09610, partial [Pirellulales bacterium]|nr:hypothetical protein [Pirellulales bacterium]
GTTDNVWTTDNIQTGITNWTIDSAGTTDTHIAPGASTDVIFIGGGAANLNTSLGADFSIKGLTFTSSATSPVTIGGNTLTIGTDGLSVQAGSAAHTINSAVTVGGSQTWQIANDSSSPLTITGALTLPASDTLTKTDVGTLRVAGAPSFGNNSSLAIDGGLIKFAMTTGSPTIGTGVTATIAAGATLELAGTVSALASAAAPAQRVNIINNSTTSGLLVSGTNQQVGAITGSGTTTIAAGGALTANSIVQSALIIGGSAGNPGKLTIAASDSSGNSLAVAGSKGLLVGSFAAAAGPSSNISTGSDSSALTPGGFASEPLAAAAFAIPSGSDSTVPEPSSILYGVIAGLGGFVTARRHRALFRML